MNNWARFACFLLFVSILGVPAFAQFPDKFTNLTVLPKDISRSDLQSTMRRFSFALGARCDHCHVEKPDKTMDFASDDKEAKKTARLMLQMVAAANRDFIAKITKPDGSTAQVECATCHRGLTQPQSLIRVLTADITDHGITHGLALYDELRGKYLGSGEYDFGERTMNQLTESLLAEGKKQDAVAVMEKHFASNHPDSIWSFHMLAMAHEANGQADKALADYQKVLELHPEDDWAKKQIAALTPPK